MKNNKGILIILLTLLGFELFAQDNSTTENKDAPVLEPFLSGVLIDNQTTLIPVKNTFEFVIQHKFGAMENGFEDLFGIYAPAASVKLGIHYVPLKNLQVGYGLHKTRMYSDFSAKYTLLEQTRRNTIPVAIGIFGNMAIDGRNKDVFGSYYQFTNRLSYFGQLLIGRKFGEWASIQATGSFAHYNMTEPGIDHDKIAIGLNGRITVNYKYAVLFQYDVPLNIKSLSEHREFKDSACPNLGIGWEIRTSAHVFQIYATSSDGFLPQHISLYNQNNWVDGSIRFGFTITRLSNFM
jgi:hypothetical protein